jgi:hypothetical protein
VSLASILLGYPGALHGTEAEPALETADQIRECMNRNLPEKSSIQDVVMETFDRVGGSRSFDAKIYWQRGEEGLQKLKLRVEAPPDLRGAAYLALERPEATDMFSYLPEVGRVRRIHPRSLGGSLFGTEFTYEDFQQMQNFGAGATLERLPDSQVNERPTYVLAAHPGESTESTYERVVSFVDQATCVALKMEFFEGGAEPKRRLLADPSSLKEEGGVWVPQQLTMKNLRDGGETRVEVKKIEMDVEIPDRQFSQGRLARRR